MLQTRFVAAVKLRGATLELNPVAWRHRLQASAAHVPQVIGRKLYSVFWI
jgi:hypothetical protein